jgi:uncharacterized protein
LTTIVPVDSNALVAAADIDERFHTRVRNLLQDRAYRFVIPALCVAEATYLIERRLGVGAEAAFLAGLAPFDVLAPEPEDWARISELVLRYADFPIGGTDASVVALAERLNTDTILTLDRKHFSAIRPRHCEAFRLLPGD